MRVKKDKTMYYTLMETERSKKSRTALGEILSKHYTLNKARELANKHMRKHNAIIFIVASGAMLKKGDIFHGDIRHTYYGKITPEAPW